MSKGELRKRQIAERTKKAAALYAQGMPRKEICQTLNISPAMLSVPLRAAGAPSRRDISKEEYERRLRLTREKHALGLSNAKIGKALGLDPNLITKLLREMGLSSNGGSGKDSFNNRIQSVVRFLKQGLSPEQIAAEMGVKPGALRNWLAPARKIIQSESEDTPPEPAVKPTARSMFGEAPLSRNHPIVVDAMWRGLEKYREPLAL